MGMSPEVADLSEAEALYDVEVNAPAAFRARHGMAALRRGGGVLLLMRGRLGHRPG